MLNANVEPDVAEPSGALRAGPESNSSNVNTVPYVKL